MAHKEIWKRRAIIERWLPDLSVQFAGFSSIPPLVPGKQLLKAKRATTPKFLQNQPVVAARLNYAQKQVPSP
jgi:UDP-N-acetylglucosamine:LPS N-acetylglucosamine transferase